MTTVVLLSLYILLPREEREWHEQQVLSLYYLFSIMWWLRSVIRSRNLGVEVFLCLDVYIMGEVGELIEQFLPHSQG